MCEKELKNHQKRIVSGNKYAHLIDFFFYNEMNHKIHVEKYVAPISFGSRCFIY